MAGLVDKRVKIFFDDVGKVLVKEGVFLGDDEGYTQIETLRGVECIPTSRVIRMEVIV